MSSYKKDHVLFCEYYLNIVDLITSQYYFSLIKKGVGMAISNVEYSCNECQRSYVGTIEKVTELMQQKRKCQMCAGGLKFPPAVQENFDEVNPSENFEYGCPKCHRSFTRPLGQIMDLIQANRTGCQICGTELKFPEEAFQQIEKISSKGPQVQRGNVDCPICARKCEYELLDPNDKISCRWCGANFRLPLESSAPLRFSSPEIQSISVEEIDQLTYSISSSDAAGTITRQAFLARGAHGDVEEAEVRDVVSSMVSLLDWHPRSTNNSTFIPLTMEEAVKLVAPVLFQTNLFHLYRREGYQEIVINIDEQSKFDTSMLLVNAVGFVSILATGSGVFQTKKEEPEAPQQTFLRVAIFPYSQGSMTGVALDLSIQIDDNPPQKAPEELFNQLAQSIFEKRSAFLAYYALLALYGPGANGSVVANANKTAIRNRLQAMGGVLAARADDWLPFLRME